MILYFLGWIIQEWFCQFGLTLRNLFWSHQGSIHCNRTRWRRLVLEAILGQRMDTLGSFPHWKQRWRNHSQTIHWVFQRERRIGDHHGFPRRQFALFVFYATRLVKNILISFYSFSSSYISEIVTLYQVFIVSKWKTKRYIVALTTKYNTKSFQLFYTRRLFESLYSECEKIL